MQLIMIYTPGRPSSELKTVNGYVRYGEWLIEEKKRLERRPGRVAEIRASRKTEDGPVKVSLWANNIAT